MSVPQLLYLTSVEWVSVSTAIIGAAAIVFGWARAFLVAPLNLKVGTLETEAAAETAARERAERDAERERRRVNELQAQLAALRVDIANLRLGKPGAFLKSEIDEDLAAASEALGVAESSIFVRSPAGEAYLVFLSIIGPAAGTLRMTRVPRGRGIAWRVLETGTLHNTADPQSDRSFYTAVDEQADHRTQALLALPLRDRERTVGVVQFLNKPGGFTRDDEHGALDWADRLAPKVARFLASPENFDALGLAWRDDLPPAAVVFSDLTASTLLLERMNVASAVDCINEYLTGQCESALRHGATIDNYLGDGLFVRFGPTHNATVDDLAGQALAAAAEMVDAFARIKAGWSAASLPVEGVFVRIGLGTGPVYETPVGHPSTRRLTVIGPTVNRASNLCESAPRDRNCIVVDEATAALAPAAWSRTPLGDGIELIPPS